MRALVPILLAIDLGQALPVALAQDAPVTVSIHFGELKTECYPACDHSTEWLQQLYAEVRDTAGVLVPAANLEFDWGVDFCNGLGYHHGFATGVGLDHVAVDGNLLKNVVDCCPACEFQAYDVGVRVRRVDEWFASRRVRVPHVFIPQEHALLPNFPNPFNAFTTVSFDLRERSKVRLDVLDLCGRGVAVLAEGGYAAGRHIAIWSAEGIPSGAYVCRLSVQSGQREAVIFTRRLAIVR